MVLQDKVILVTGGTGSFGQKFTEIALREHNPKVIRIFSRGELLQEQMRQRFNNDRRLRFLSAMSGIGKGYSGQRMALTSSSMPQL